MFITQIFIKLYLTIKQKTLQTNQVRGIQSFKDNFVLFYIKKQLKNKLLIYYKFPKFVTTNIACYMFYGWQLFLEKFKNYKTLPITENQPDSL